MNSATDRDNGRWKARLSSTDLSLSSLTMCSRISLFKSIWIWMNEWMNDGCRDESDERKSERGREREKSIISFNRWLIFYSQPMRERASTCRQTSVSNDKNNSWVRFFSIFYVIVEEKRREEEKRRGTNDDDKDKHRYTYSYAYLCLRKMASRKESLMLLLTMMMMTMM